MMGMTAGAKSGDFDKALALLAAAADPEGVKARILELQAAEDAARQEKAEAQADIFKLRGEREQFDAEKAERIANLDAREAEIARQNEELSRRKTDIERRDASVTMSRAKLDDDRKKFEEEQARFREKAQTEEKRWADTLRKQDERDAGLCQKEIELNDRATKLADGEAALAAKVQELNEATAKFRVK